MMRSRIRRTVGVLLAILFTWGVIRLSAVPYHPAGVDQGVLRLAWRISTQGEEVCRAYTAEELAELPVHMRRDEVCERPRVRWKLAVTLDGSVLAERDLQGGGARKDSPVSLFEEWPLDGGEHDLDVLLTRSDAQRGDPEWMHLRETITVVPGGVHLVWIHPETGRMMLSH